MKIFIPLENTPRLVTGLYHILRTPLEILSLTGRTRGLIPRVSSLTGFIFTLFMLLQITFAFSEIYDLDFTARDKEAEALSQEDIFIKLMLKEAPQQPFPIFIYNVEKVKNPHKIPSKVFKDSIFLLDKGNYFFSLGNYDKAIESYKKAITVNPSFVSCYYNLGVTYSILGRYSESIKNFETVVSIQPLNGYPYLYLGWIYKRLENPGMSEHYLKIARRIFASQDDISLVRKTEAILESLKFFPEE